MARGDLTCPICGSLLGLPSFAVQPGTNVARAGALGGHIHIVASGTMTCVQGHRWTLKGDFMVEREA